MVTQDELNNQLLRAVIGNNDHKIKELLQQGAEIDFLSNYTSNTKINRLESGEEVTPLFYALANRNVEATLALIEHGANVNFITQENYVSPLLVYHYWGSGYLSIIKPEITKALLEAGADIYHSNSWGDTPLHLAAQSRSLDSAMLLLAAGSPVHVRNCVSWVPRTDNPELEEILSQLAKDPTTRPTPQAVGLDINKRNAALARMGKAIDSARGASDESNAKNAPETILTLDEVIKRHQQQALENDEGI